VLNIGYDLGLVSRPLFTMLVLMAVLSTVVTTPLLRHWLGGTHHLRHRSHGMRTTNSASSRACIQVSRTLSRT
jgi:hypothetical protein